VPEPDQPNRETRATQVVGDLVLLVALVIMLGMIFRPAMEVARLQGDVRYVSGEARRLYDAFERYHRTNGSYPNSYLEPPFDVDSLDPLRRRGYYTGQVTTKLIERRLDGYDSPDDRGPNQEYWIEMTLDRDPEIRFLIGRSDDAPSAGGSWVEGAFLVRDGVLEPL